MKVGLFFGSFNPFHIGHKVIACHTLEFTQIEQVWLIVSPENPLKNKSQLLDPNARFIIVEKSTKGISNLLPSKIEFNLEKPSYTSKTLIFLKNKYPNHEFSLIIGEDNLINLSQWKDYQNIVEKHILYVYPRFGFSANFSHPNIRHLVKMPKIEISSTFIRKSIKKGDDISYLLNKNAWDYIKRMNFYNT